MNVFLLLNLLFGFLIESEFVTFVTFIDRIEGACCGWILDNTVSDKRRMQFSPSLFVGKDPIPIGDIVHCSVDRNP